MDVGGGGVGQTREKKAELTAKKGSTPKNLREQKNKCPNVEEKK